MKYPFNFSIAILHDEPDSVPYYNSLLNLLYEGFISNPKVSPNQILSKFSNIFWGLTLWGLTFWGLGFDTLEFGI